jgi:hypothetical protein
VKSQANNMIVYYLENGECFMNTLGHIVTLSRSRSDFVDAGVLHLVKNMSEHEPIYAVIKVEDAQSNDDDIPKVEARAKPSWKDQTKNWNLMMSYSENFHT